MVIALDVGTSSARAAPSHAPPFGPGPLGFAARGRPATPVYMWADTRSAEDARLLHDALDEPALHARTGCHLHSSYWPAKLPWLARARPGVLRDVARWGSPGED